MSEARDSEEPEGREASTAELLLLTIASVWLVGWPICFVVGFVRGWVSDIGFLNGLAGSWIVGGLGFGLVGVPILRRFTEVDEDL